MWFASFVRGKKKPSEVVKTLSKNLDVLVKAPSDRQVEKSVAFIIKCFGELKVFFVGSDKISTGKKKKRDEPRPENVQIVAEYVVNLNVFIVLITQMHKMPFESKKDIAFLFNFLFRHEVVFQEYVLANPSIIWTIVSGYRPENKAVSMACGKMLEECVKHVKVAHLILTSNELWRFLDTYVLLKDFETQSSAFNVLKSLLTMHPAISADFFTRRYDKFFTAFNSLLCSDEYVVRRHATKIMYHILVLPYHAETMLQYSSSKVNLKIWMNLLRDDSEQVQLDAFHVFKLFVANPHMPEDVKHTLTMNRHRMVDFLSPFLAKHNDENFVTDKSIVIGQLKRLKDVPFSDLTSTATVNH